MEFSPCQTSNRSGLRLRQGEEETMRAPTATASLGLGASMASAAMIDCAERK
jgi:hypothetical protein